MKKITILVLGLMYSAIIGAITVLFLTLEHILLAFFWEYLPKHIHFDFDIYIAIVIAGLGALVYMVKTRFGNFPETGGEALARLKKETGVKKYNVAINFVTALLILAMGAGVGPEAALLGIIVSLSIWQADKLRYVYFNYDEFRALALREKFHRLFAFRQYLVSRKNKKASKLKLVLQVVMIANGIVAFFFLKRFSDQPPFITKLGHGDWEFSDLKILGITVLFGLLLGITYKLLRKYIKLLFDKVIKSNILKIVLGSLAIYLVCLYNEDLLFSGQTTMPLVVKYGHTLTSWQLMVFVFVKMLLLIICLSTGLKGGDIFPLLFIGLLEGYAIANIYPETDYLVILAIATVSFLSIASEEFIIAMIFMSLFFPLSYAAIIYTVGIVLFFIVRYTKKQLSKKQKNPALEAGKGEE